jgi:hypothetical protein
VVNTTSCLVNYSPSTTTFECKIFNEVWFEFLYKNQTYELVKFHKGIKIVGCKESSREMKESSG